MTHILSTFLSIVMKTNFCLYRRRKAVLSAESGNHGVSDLVSSYTSW